MNPAAVETNEHSKRGARPSRIRSVAVRALRVPGKCEKLHHALLRLHLANSSEIVYNLARSAVQGVDSVRLELTVKSVSVCALATDF